MDVDKQCKAICKDSGDEDKCYSECRAFHVDVDIEKKTQAAKIASARNRSSTRNNLSSKLSGLALQISSDRKKAAEVSGVAAVAVVALIVVAAGYTYYRSRKHR